MGKIVETKTCKWTWEKFPIYKSEIEMLEKLSPVIGWEKFKLPTPDLSPKAREINRLMFRNERNFYKIKLKNGKSEISTIHPSIRKNIINIEDFNNYDFGKEWINYSWNFNEDLKKLFTKCPHASRLVVDMENSPYCNQEAYDKNCYMNSGWHNNKDSMYTTFAIESSDLVDNYWIFRSEIVYSSLNIFESSKIFFSQQIKNSYNIYFGYNLIWCQNVIFWNNLHNKKYVYKNKELRKEDWIKKEIEFKSKLKTLSWLEKLKKEYKKLLKTTWKEEKFIETSENIYWNIITSSKDNFSTLYWIENNNILYSNIIWETNDSMDINSFARWSKLYNITSSFWLHNSISSSLILESSNWYYSFSIESMKYFFGCFGFWLKNKSYMILNKQYSKKEWELLAKQIIKELQEKWKWWRFLEPELSPYPYNDSVAMEYHPIKKAIFLDWKKILQQEIIRDNWEWTVYILEPNNFISKAIIDFGWEEKINTYWRTKENEINIPESLKIIKANNLPEIEEVNDSILNKAIICKKSWRPFRLVKKELEFYKKYSLPIPKIHYDERHLERIKNKTINYYKI